MAVIWSRLYAYSCGTVCQYRISLLLLSILADLVVVGFLKILIRRERPLYNQDDQVRTFIQQHPTKSPSRFTRHRSQTNSPSLLAIPRGQPCFSSYFSSHSRSPF